MDASSPWIFLQGKIAELCLCKHEHWLTSTSDNDNLGKLIRESWPDVSLQINPTSFQGRSILLRAGPGWCRKIFCNCLPAKDTNVTSHHRPRLSLDRSSRQWILVGSHLRHNSFHQALAYVSWNQVSAVEQEDVAQAEKSCISSHLICGAGVDEGGVEPWGEMSGPSKSTPTHSCYHLSERRHKPHTNNDRMNPA